MITARQRCCADSCNAAGVAVGYANRSCMAAVFQNRCIMTHNAPGTACCGDIPGYGTISDAAAVFSGNAAQICFSGEVDFFQIQVFYHAVSADHAEHSTVI